MSATLITLVCLFGLYVDVYGYLIEFGGHPAETDLRNGNLRITQHKIRMSKQNGKSQNVTLPKDIIDRVKTFVFFLGHAHSGHSIVGSLMDAHPHMVVAYEANVFQDLCTGNLAPNKDDIFNRIWRNTVVGTMHGHRVNMKKGYSLLVDGLYEGKYVDHIEVIGDKKAGTTTNLLARQEDKFLNSLATMKSLVDSVKMIHVIRNPYDNIATSLMYAKISSQRQVTSVKNSKEIFKTDNASLSRQIKSYFKLYEAVEHAKKSYKLDYIEVHGNDLVSDARGTISRMCNGLGVFCSDSYLDVCSDKVFKTESKTRYKINWDKEHIDEVQRNIDRFSTLNGYTFDS